MIRIESLTPEHAAELNALIKAGLKDFPTSFTTDFSNVENRPDNLVAEHLQSLQSIDDFRLGAFVQDDLLVGTVRLIRQRSPKQIHAAEIVFLFVHRDHQNQGIGELLMRSAIEKAQQISGLEQLHLAVCVDAQAAIRLYERAGFESTGIIRQQIKVNGRYYDQHCMWLSLKDA